MATENLEQVEKEIEISIEAAKEAVDRMKLMDDLIADKKFQTVFIDGYMEKEPARLVSLLADPEWQSEERQSDLLNDMRAISSFRQYIVGIRAMGRQMERQIEASTKTLEELREEAEGA